MYTCAMMCTKIRKNLVVYKKKSKKFQFMNYF